MAARARGTRWTKRVERSSPFDAHDATPVQWAGMHKSVEAMSTGSRRLALAVIEQAVSDMRLYPPASDVHREAKWWVLSDDMTWPYSFVSLCHMLGFDVHRMRARILVAPVQHMRRKVLPNRSIGAKSDYSDRSTTEW